MEFTKLEATLRQTRGKGPARRMRRDGMVPAVVYGKGIDTITLSINPRELTHALSGPLRINTVLEIEVKNAPKDVPNQIHVLVKDHQYHPVRRDLIHVDFLAVDVNAPVTVDVPLITMGRAIGVQTGGVLSQVYRSLLLECLPAAIPAHVEVDISELDVNDNLSIKDVELPEGVTVALDPETTIISVMAPKAVEEKKEGEEEGEEAAAEGEEKPEDEKAEDAEKKE